MLENLICIFYAVISINMDELSTTSISIYNLAPSNQIIYALSLGVIISVVIRPDV